MSENNDSTSLTLVRSTDPETSSEAAKSVNLGRSIDYVYDTLHRFGPFADHELVEFHEGDHTGIAIYGRFSPQRIRTARATLTQRGDVEPTGEYTRTPSGRRARIWRTTAKRKATPPPAKKAA